MKTKSKQQQKQQKKKVCRMPHTAVMVSFKLVLHMFDSIYSNIYKLHFNCPGSVVVRA